VAQLWALVRATVRELRWGLPRGALELRHWRLRAQIIPDPALRSDAVHSLTRKRANADGAALFSTLTGARSQALLRVIVAYETIWDYLDNVSERGAAAGEINGRQLHLALSEGLDLDAPLSNYYRHNQCVDDMGYLRVLVRTCQLCCAMLPFYGSVRELLIQEGRRSDVGALNHALDAEYRNVALARWAAQEYPGTTEASWFELTAAASCSAVVHVLLAIAAERTCDEHRLARIYTAYFPWFSIAVTMLDSYVDQAEDAASGAHMYIAHYPSSDVAVQSVRDAIARCTCALRDLPNGSRHAVIAACMVAMYTSKDSARASDMRATTASMIAAGGLLARLLVPVLRIWRVAYGQQSA
jgi:tetraprenyl-beta-curcumene synthase